MCYNQMFDNIKEGILPDVEELHRILDEVAKRLVQEQNIILINDPVNVIGDLHGQFFDFCKILNLFEFPSADNKYLFLGDYVDRGFNSVELMISVILLKLLETESVFLLRGNHESKGMSTNYTFRQECVAKYDDIIFFRFCEIFTFLPVCAIVNDTILCIHGGLTPKLDLQLLKNEDRFEELPSFHDVYWSDPDDSVDEYKNSPRGAGYLFGKNDVNKFLEKNNLDCIIRSHQLVQSGFDSKFGGKVLTVWSAPNYVYTYGNGAAILSIKDKQIVPKYFEKAEPQFSSNCVFDCINKV